MASGETDPAPPAATAHLRLPDVLPVFPLTGVVLLPGGRLPLNIFEPRYLAMVEDALGNGRVLGIIQPSGEGADKLYELGGVGRISSFSETEDGRFLITLNGLCRFVVREELPLQRGYRRVVATYDPYQQDLQPPPPVPPAVLDRPRLLAGLRAYFRAQNIGANWEALEQTQDERLITSLAMICPFSPNEKQALLEARTLADRARLLTALIEMAVLHDTPDEQARH